MAVHKSNKMIMCLTVMFLLVLLIGCQNPYHQPRMEVLPAFLQPAGYHAAHATPNIPMTSPILNYPDGSLYIPILTGTEIQYNKSYGIIKVINGRSVFWEHTNPVANFMNWGGHDGLEEIITIKNIYHFKLNNRPLNHVLREYYGDSCTGF